MEEIKSVNVVFIGRGDMLKQLCGEKHDSSFAVASVQYHGLFPKVKDVKLFSEAQPSLEETISKADKVFILCSTEKELNEYIQKISHLPITSKFVVMAPDKVKKNAFIRKLTDTRLKSELDVVPFIGTLEKHLQPKLLELYPEDMRELIQRQYQQSLEERKRKDDEETARKHREYAKRNPNADLKPMLAEIKAFNEEIVGRAGLINANCVKAFVDDEIKALEELEGKFNEKVKEYKSRISETKDDLHTQLEAPLIESSDEVKAAMEAAIAVQTEINARIAEDERIERERVAAIEAADLARRERLEKLQGERILSFVTFEVQREVELNSIEEYVASVNFAEEGQNADVVCVVFDPTLPNCENHLRKAVDIIKADQERNPSLRAVFLRARPYSMQQDLGFGEELQAHPEKDSDAQMIKGLGIVDPVVVDNLRDFKDRAGYGQPVVFRKVEEYVEPADVGELGRIGGAEPEFVEPSVVNEPKKNPHRWSGKDFKHARFERKAKLQTYFDGHGPGKANTEIDLDWLQLQLLSMEKNCQTARDIKVQVGSQIDALSAEQKVNQERYKVVIDLLKLLDKEERRIKPKVITFFANANYSEKYIAKREEQRNLIYTTAEAIYDRLKVNPDVNAVLEGANDILEGLKVKGSADGHVVKGIQKIIGNEKNRVQQQVRAI